MDYVWEYSISWKDNKLPIAMSSPQNAVYIEE